MGSTITHILNGLRVLQKYDSNGYSYTDGQTIIVVSDSKSLTEKEKKELECNNWSESGIEEWFIHL